MVSATNVRSQSHTDGTECEKSNGYCSVDVHHMTPEVIGIDFYELYWGEEEEKKVV